uniref:Uncharacterized protein n=1 Tax=Arundo donax TaxID=35708 RepID=A0A0A8ZYI5_ARUDO
MRSGRWAHRTIRRRSEPGVR